MFFPLKSQVAAYKYDVDYEGDSMGKLYFKIVVIFCPHTIVLLLQCRFKSLLCEDKVNERRYIYLSHISIQHNVLFKLLMTILNQTVPVAPTSFEFDQKSKIILEIKFKVLMYDIPGKKKHLYLLKNVVILS